MENNSINPEIENINGQEAVIKENVTEEAAPEQETVYNEPVQNQGYEQNNYNQQQYGYNQYYQNPQGYGYGQTYQYQQPYGYGKPYGYAPVAPRKTNKGLLKYILLSILTFGIYGLVVMSSVSNDINIAASRYDGKRTMHYCLLAFIVGPITFGIAYLVWYHNLSERMGRELARRGIYYNFDASTYWLWNVLGSFIFIGPFIYYYKLFEASNLICGHYNING